MHRPLLIIALLIGSIVVFCAQTGGEKTSPAPPVMILEARGIIGPAFSEYVLKGLDQANQQQAALVILQLDTPGGLDSSMRDIIKAILASKMVSVAADPRGLNHVFTFFAMPGRRTAFCGISAVAPGCYLRIHLDRQGTVADVRAKQYWDFDFPDWGDEYRPAKEKELVDQLDETLLRAIRIRMRADVPVAAYLSGGVDSATLVIGTPTVLVGAHPSVAYAVYMANALRPKLKFAAIIGSYAWGGKAVEQIVGLIPNLKVEMLDTVLCKGIPGEGDFEALDKLATAIAEKHREHNIN